MIRLKLLWNSKVNINYKIFPQLRKPGGEKKILILLFVVNREYVWFIGDDDRIANGGIQKVLTVLKEYPKLAAIFVNCKVFDRDFKDCRVIK
jgi:hypothetical protein